MKRNPKKTGDRSHNLSARDLASVRGGGIQGSGHNSVIHVQDDNGAIRTQ